MRQQLDKYKESMVEAEQRIEAATEYGNQTRELFPACLDLVVMMEGAKQAKMARIEGDIREDDSALWNVRDTSPSCSRGGSCSDTAELKYNV